MIHILLHFLLPWLIAMGFYQRRWLSTTLILWATMLVDLDHLLASPIYDPLRCSIGFHPLHTVPAIAVYLLLAFVPLLVKGRKKAGPGYSPLSVIHLVGIGLLIHMALDATDCLQM